MSEVKPFSSTEGDTAPPCTLSSSSWGLERCRKITQQARKIDWIASWSDWTRTTGQFQKRPVYPSTLGGSWIRETLHRHHVALPSVSPVLSLCRVDHSLVAHDSVLSSFSSIISEPLRITTLGYIRTYVPGYGILTGSRRFPLRGFFLLFLFFLLSFST